MASSVDIFSPLDGVQAAGALPAAGRGLEMLVIEASATVGDELSDWFCASESVPRKVGM